MADQDQLTMSRAIDVLQNEFDQQLEILISTRSGRALTEAERLAFFRRLEGQSQAQPELTASFLNQTGFLISSLHLQQTPPEGVMEHLTQFGKWVEDTFSDPGLLRDSAQALSDLGKAYSAGAPINTAGNSILPIMIQIGAKILGLG